MIKVSYFSNVEDTDPKDINLEDWLKRTLDISDKFSAKVLKYRITKKKKHKEKIPCITISASFGKYRNLKNIKKKNNFICLDVDRYSKGNKKPSNVCIDMFRVKKLFIDHPCTFFTGFSTGGDGVYAIIRIADTDLEKYFNHFQEKFAKIGINIDSSCKDYTRLRFFSLDVAGYFNPDAKNYKIKEKEELKPVNRKAVSIDDEQKVEFVIELMEQQGIDITSDYNDWIKIGGALYNTFGERGRDYFHRISKLHPDYKFSKADKKFDNCRKMNKTNLASLFYIADSYGIRY